MKYTDCFTTLKMDNENTRRFFFTLKNVFLHIQNKPAFAKEVDNIFGMCTW